MGADDNDEGGCVTKNWDSPRQQMGVIGAAGQGEEQGTNKSFFQFHLRIPNLAQRNSLRLMDEESSGRKIWVICQVWRESSSRLLTRRKGGRRVQNSYFPSAFLDKTADNYSHPGCYNLYQYTHGVVRSNWICEDQEESQAVLRRCEAVLSWREAVLRSVICLLAIVVSNMGQVDMSIAMLKKKIYCSLRYMSKFGCFKAAHLLGYQGLQGFCWKV